MLKKITLIYEIIFTIFVVWYIVEQIMSPGLLSSSFISTLKASYAEQFITYNSPGLFTIVIASLILQKKNDNYFIRMAPVLSIVTLFAFFLYSLATNNIAGLSIANNTFAQITGGILTISLLLYIYVIPLLLLAMVNPNNVLASILKKISFITVGLNLISGIWFYIATSMLGSLPNVYSSVDSLAQSTTASLEISIKVFVVTIIIETFAIAFTMITNYALETETIQAEELDYEELMKRADYVAQAKQDYALGKTALSNGDIDRSVSEQTGAMNVDNQLGVDSNVGKVSEASKDSLKRDYIEKGLISVGRVENSAIEKKTEAPVQEVKAPEPTIPNLTVAPGAYYNVNQNVPVNPAITLQQQVQMQSQQMMQQMPVPGVPNPQANMQQMPGEPIPVQNQPTINQ